MERENLEEVGVDRKIILKRILRKQAGDQRRTVVDMVIDIRVQ
jgi:hypothetical protein